MGPCCSSSLSLTNWTELLKNLRQSIQKDLNLRWKSCWCCFSSPEHVFRSNNLSVTCTFVVLLVPVLSWFWKLFVVEHGAESGSFRLVWLLCVNTSHIGTRFLMSESRSGALARTGLSPLTSPSQRRSMFPQTGEALFLRSLLPLLLWRCVPHLLVWAVCTQENLCLTPDCRVSLHMNLLLCCSVT